MSPDGTEQGERFGYSKLTDTWYLVTAWKDLQGDKIQAQSKEQVDRSEVPQQLLDVTDERSVDTETNQTEDQQ